MHTLTGTKGHEGCSFDLTFSSLDEAETFDVSKILSIDDIFVTPNAVPASGDLNQFTHLRGLNYPQVHGATVTLLIGPDVPEVFCMRSVHKGARGQLVAFETPLGWSLLGPSLSFSSSNVLSTL